MKFWKQTLLLSVVFIAILSTAIYSACQRDVCNNVSCSNGGSCNAGVCVCPLGYEGPTCEDLSVTRYLGTYTGYTICDSNAQVFDTATIATDGVAINTVSITWNGIKPKILHGYVSSNASTYSVIITNNDDNSTAKTIYTRTFAATVQSDNTLKITSFVNIEDSTDSINTKCTFLGTKE